MTSGTNPTCAVETMADGSKRIIATRSIERGAILLIDTPIIHAIERAASYRAWSMVRQLLADHDRLKWFLQMLFSTTPQRWDSEDDENSIKLEKTYSIDRNTIRYLYFTVATNHVCYFDASSEIAGSGLYETLCFFNHSCAPNSAPASVAGVSDRHAALCATQRIRSNDEITFSYANAVTLTSQSTEDRREKLKLLFGFFCRCVLCESGER
jgi:hypothetical protein